MILQMSGDRCFNFISNIRIMLIESDWKIVSSLTHMLLMAGLY